MTFPMRSPLVLVTNIPSRTLSLSHLMGHLPVAADFTRKTLQTKAQSRSANARARVGHGRCTSPTQAVGQQKRGGGKARCAMSSTTVVPDLMSVIHRQITPEAVRAIASRLGEDRERTAAAVSAGIPSVLTALSDVARSETGA